MKCPFELPVKLKDGGPGDREIISKLNQSICRIWCKADADYIVQAINSHEKLVNTLKKFRDECDDNNHNKHHKEFHRMCKICVIDKTLKEAGEE